MYVRQAYIAYAAGTVKTLHTSPEARGVVVHFWLVAAAKRGDCRVTAWLSSINGNSGGDSEAARREGGAGAEWTAAE